MEHRFVSQRSRLATLQEVSRTLRDVKCVLTMSTADRVLFDERCEDRMADDAVRKSVGRLAGRLGDAVRHVAGKWDDALLAHESAWKRFLASETVDTGGLGLALAKAMSEVDAHVATLEPVERVSEASSCSDYSDSDTESSDLGRRDEEESGEEEESGGEEESEDDEGSEEDESEEEEEEGKGYKGRDKRQKR